jgi:hypothetical protein
MEAKPLIASRFQLQRVEPKDAPLGALVLFQPPTTDQTIMAFGILADGVDAQHPSTRGIVQLGAAYEFVSINQVNVAAIFEGPWQVVPDVAHAQYRAPEPGDLMIPLKAATGMGLVHDVAPRRWGLLSLNTATATIWRADRAALVMPWHIVSGDNVIVHGKPLAAADSAK